MIETVYAWVETQLQTNEIFAGIIGGSLFASLLYSLRSVPHLAWRLFLLQGTCQITVYNDDEAFGWLAEWLSAHPYAKRTRRLRLTTFFAHNPDDSGMAERWQLAPGIGAHLFWHRGRPIWMRREVQEGGDSGGAHRRKETIDIRTLGRDPGAIRTLVDEAREIRERRDRIDVHVYRHCWQLGARKMRRPLDTVILPETQIDRLVRDTAWFISARDWYAARGVPYRRGYLLSGPPGCGKTSLVMGLASHFGMPIYALNLGSIWGDNNLFEALSSVPARALLLIEDIDAANTPKARRKLETGANEPQAQTGQREDDAPITMSGLLNAIDGVASVDGRLLVMTTNHPEALDHALIRPGRVDLHEHIGPLGAEDARRLFRRFFPGHHDAAEAFVSRCPAAMPAAQLQGLFMRHSGSPWAAVEAVRRERGEVAA